VEFPRCFVAGGATSTRFVVAENSLPSGIDRILTNDRHSTRLIQEGSTLKLDKNLGMLLLAIWLLLTGLAVLGVSFSGLRTVQGLLAVAAGILLIIRR
jgi:hypothetical protein